MIRRGGGKSKEKGEAKDKLSGARGVTRDEAGSKNLIMNLKITLL